MSITGVFTTSNGMLAVQENCPEIREGETNTIPLNNIIGMLNIKQICVFFITSDMSGDFEFFF